MKNSHFPTLPPTLQDVVANHWYAYRQACHDNPLDNPRFLESYSRVWGVSNFVALRCSQQPAMLADLFNSGDMLRSYQSNDYSAALGNEVASCDSEAQLTVCLRAFRHREMVRIAWRDLAGWAEVTETLQDLTALADCCIAYTIDWLHNNLSKQFGSPKNKKGTPQQLITVALGKLGGSELNFSSDIDLMFVYPQRGNTEGEAISISNEEFFTRMAQKFTHLLNELTEDGFVFRVDLRLRPFGDSGPLAMSMPAVEAYYQQQGREWERYALVKARYVTGNQRDITELKTILRSFVYRRYIDYGAIDSLREMKRLLSRQTQYPQRYDNLKQGAGGIREVEFIVQVFQIIRGGLVSELQQTRLLTVLALLRREKKLAEEMISDLQTAYLFLRRTEHIIQMIADRQTQNLPEEQVDRERVAYGMGYPDWDAFMAALDVQRDKVSRHFNGIIADPEHELPQHEDELALTDFSTIWRGDIASGHIFKLLAKYNYLSNEKTVVEKLMQLRASQRYKHLSQVARNRLNKLMPLLLYQASHTHDPAEALQRLLLLIDSIIKRSAYMALLLENPAALQELVKLFASSAWVADYISQYPQLVNELLDAAILYKPLDEQQLEEELQRYLLLVPADDDERQLNYTYQLKHSQLLRIGATAIQQQLAPPLVGRYLANLATVILRRLQVIVERDLIERHGVVANENNESSESDDSHEINDKDEFGIVAYGRLGSSELGFNSDLDLVYLHLGDGQQMTAGLRPLSRGEYFIRLGQRITNLLSLQGIAGRFYDVDVRLRPSGSAGLLVSSMDAFVQYQREQAWTWEHQALVRARMISGCQRIRDKFEQARRCVLQQARDPEQLRVDIAQMRGRQRQAAKPAPPGLVDLREAPGGITDIEFMVQYAVLRWAGQYPALVAPRDNLSLLAIIGQEGLFPTAEIELLSDAYQGYWQRMNDRAMQKIPEMLVPENEFSDWRQQIATIWSRVIE